MPSLLAHAHRTLTFAALESILPKTPGTCPFAPVPGSLLYVCHNALPFDASGYTTRTQEILRALRADGHTVQGITRTGYPWDRHKGLSQTPGTEVDGVPYAHLPKPKNNCFTAIYAARASRVLQEALSVLRPACLHAASNHVNALPVLIAARRLGLPFQYEIRGLWELSRAANIPGYEKNHNFALGLELEGFVARHADRIFVLSNELARFAETRWQVPPERIRLLPNCADTQRIRPCEQRPDQEQDRQRANPKTGTPFVLGFAGSIVEYEGLDLLLHALADLATAQGPLPLRVELLGDGAARPALEALARKLCLSRIVKFLGHVPQDEARRRVRGWTMICLPRKPYEVCRLVPPLKLVEAMAMAKPLLVPDLPLFHEETGDNALFFRPGDAEDLARVLSRVLADPTGLEHLGHKAREHVVRCRQWSLHLPQVMELAYHRD